MFRLSVRLWIGMAVGALVAASAAGAQQAATTSCKDGTTTTASGRGACSGHVGVDRAATKAARTTTRKATENAAQVTCTDGTTSKAGRGACSHHGGISNATAAQAAA